MRQRSIVALGVLVVSGMVLSLGISGQAQQAAQKPAAQKPQPKIMPAPAKPAAAAATRGAQIKPTSSASSSLSRRHLLIVT